MSISAGKGAHILVFPYPAQGHILPILDLTHQLVLHGLTITILVTPKNLPILNPLISTHPSIQTLVFSFPHHPRIPDGVENVKDMGNFGNVFIINALSKLRDPIIQWFKSHPTPPVALISDFFLGWTQNLAHEIGIPRIVFYSSGPFFTSVLIHCVFNIKTLRSLRVVEFSDLPRSPSFIEEHLPSIVRRYRESDPEWEFVKDGMIANISSWGSVFNSFDGLEGEYMAYLRKKMGHGRVYGVGPVSLVADSSVRDDPISDHSGVMEWFDGCPDGSVLYVCFGSQRFLKRDQMEALAYGLEQSGVRFAWVAKNITAQQETDGYGSIPDGFEERVTGRAIVMKGWAPQVSILSHRAVGGFLSHCGWNSVLEALVRGVMILAWPMEADQFVNAKLLVEYMGAAVLMCEGEFAVPDSDELARRIAKSMSGNSSEKVRAKELRDKALEAVKVGGSSSRDMEVLVRDFAQLLVTKGG
ncbi:unnamed protein product [Ilex paraguariensis]|uniref:Glycosyltransferase n=1 Tax=Ilex paraguariensis TaxID=185542 RepID=A0ABC8RIH1_9AQUA